MSSRAQKQKSYGNLQTLLILTHKSKDLSIDSVTGLLKSKNRQEKKYDSILVIVDRLTKMNGTLQTDIHKYKCKTTYQVIN